MDDKDRAVDANLHAPSMLANLMTAAAAYAVQRGLSLERIAESAGLAPKTLIAAPERVPEDAVSRILNLLQHRFPDEAVALEMAAAAPLHFLGPLAPLIRLAPNLRAGIKMFVQFRSLLSTRAVLELVEVSPGPMLRFEHPNDEEFGALSAEMGIAMGTRVITEGFSLPNSLREVWFDHQPIAPRGRYTEFFPVPVRFNASCNALLFHAARLDDPVDPVAGAQLRVLRAHLDLVRQQLEQQGEPPELRRIRDAAARNAAHQEYGAAALARLLGMSLRTLQRRVDALGTSVRSLIDGVREATARQLISDPELSLLEVAYALGYSTESAFRRAFRRWTGQSPAHYRRSLAAATCR
ncbi:MAG: AraC family transcriptional regulator ligand-binding domain-containing protein [Nannocystaceae bacterium]